MKLKAVTTAVAIKDPVNLTENITNKSRTPAVYKIHNGDKPFNCDQ